jgi:hypothetical protein
MSVKSPRSHAVPAPEHRLPNVFDRSIDCTLIDIRHRHLCAFTRERGRDGAPEASSSSENKRRLPFSRDPHAPDPQALPPMFRCLRQPGERSSTYGEA